MSPKQGQLAAKAAAANLAKDAANAAQDGADLAKAACECTDGDVDYEEAEDEEAIGDGWVGGQEWSAQTKKILAEDDEGDGDADILIPLWGSAEIEYSQAAVHYDDAIAAYDDAIEAFGDAEALYISADEEYSLGL